MDHTYMSDKSWMYKYKTKHERVNPNFLAGVQYFMDFAVRTITKEGTIKCPCSKCENKFNQEKDVVHFHIVREGFTQRYTTWRFHGESQKRTRDEVHAHIDSMDDMAGRLSDAFMLQPINKGHHRRYGRGRGLGWSRAISYNNVQTAASNETIKNPTIELQNAKAEIEISRAEREAGRAEIEALCAQQRERQARMERLEALLNAHLSDNSPINKGHHRNYGRGRGLGWSRAISYNNVQTAVSNETIKNPTIELQNAKAEMEISRAEREAGRAEIEALCAQQRETQARMERLEALLNAHLSDNSAANSGRGNGLSSSQTPN